jgi:hypothetical protein
MPDKARRKEQVRQAAMREAVAWLRGHGVRFDQPSDHHLKIGRVNFWPTTGKIMADGDCGPFEVPGLPGPEFAVSGHIWACLWQLSHWKRRASRREQGDSGRKCVGTRLKAEPLPRPPYTGYPWVHAAARWPARPPAEELIGPISWLRRTRA